MSSHELKVVRANNEEQGLIITCTKPNCDFYSTTHTLTIDYFKVIERNHNDQQHELCYYPVIGKLACGALGCDWEKKIDGPISLAEMNMLQKAHNDSAKAKR